MVSQYFPGFTLIRAEGWYKGQKEESVVIEIVGGSGDKGKVQRLAAVIGAVNKQESVLVGSLSSGDFQFIPITEGVA
jgi:hypothetical protein